MNMRPRSLSQEPVTRLPMDPLSVQLRDSAAKRAKEEAKAKLKSLSGDGSLGSEDYGDCMCWRPASDDVVDITFDLGDVTVNCGPDFEVPPPEGFKPLDMEIDKSTGKSYMEIKDIGLGLPPAIDYGKYRITEHAEWLNENGVRHYRYRMIDDKGQEVVITGVTVSQGELVPEKIYNDEHGVP